MKIYKGEFDKKLELQIAPAIMAGFPSPAEEYFFETLDFNRDMIRHPESTFYGRVTGDSMIDVGIEEGDIAVIDKSVIAEHGDIVIAYLNG
jgi:DNA polymerase V